MISKQISDEYRATIQELKSWIKENGHTRMSFSELTGIPYHTLVGMLSERENGMRLFSPREASTIERVTDGLISASELVPHLVPEGYALVNVKHRDRERRELLDIFNGYTNVLMESAPEYYHQFLIAMKSNIGSRINKAL